MEQNIKKSPLELLVAYQQAQVSPTKAVPKARFESDKTAIIPKIEDIASLEEFKNGRELHISNSSLTLNFNVNIDSKIVDKALAKTKEVAKNVAAASVALLGSAFILGNDSKKPAKIRIPLMPKIKLPKID